MLKFDLHMHSYFSFDSLNHPEKIVQHAIKAGLDGIAITDHNSMANCKVYEKFAERNDIKFIYGVEIQSAEEIHILSFFDEWSNAQEFDNLLYESLLPRKNYRIFLKNGNYSKKVNYRIEFYERDEENNKI